MMHPDATTATTGPAQARPANDVWRSFSPASIYFVLLVMAAAMVFVWQAPQVSGEWTTLGALVVLHVAAGLLPISIYGDSHITVSFVITLVIIVLFGVPGAAIVGLAASVGPSLLKRSLGRKTLPNAALFILADAAAAAAYGVVANVDPETASLGLAAGVALATIVSFSLTAFLISVPYWLTRTLPLRAFWDRHAWLAPQHLAMGAIGYGLAVAEVELGWAGIIAFVVPAFVMRLTMKLYVDKTEQHVERLSRQNEALEKANIDVLRVSDELRVRNIALEVANSEVVAAQEQLLFSYDETLEALVNALDARDQETKGHSMRVSRYMMEVARQLGVRPGSAEWLDMQRGSLLHDVGKIGVGDAILLKPGKLTDDEWLEMRRHPGVGYQMLKQISFLKGAAEIILTHHERWDGKGYPRGLTQDAIPLGARIFVVVDTFDAITSDRPYRRAAPADAARAEILKHAGSQFDPRIVEAFMETYPSLVREMTETNPAWADRQIA
jgi:putative nucleotidyltransferase with HDIG domain